MLAYKSIWYNPTTNSIDFKNVEDKTMYCYYLSHKKDFKKDIATLLPLMRNVPTDILYDIECFIKRGGRLFSIKIYPRQGVLYNEH